jgi:hypothetical protein
MLCLLALYALTSSIALAQSAPTYPERLISLPDAEQREFAHWIFGPTLVVPTANLQAVLDTEAGGPGLFLPLGEGGQSLVFPSATIEVLRETAAGVLLPPASRLAVLALAFNLTLGRLEAVYIGFWDSDAAGTNTLAGSSVATQAKFESELEQEQGKQVLKIKVEGKDGFRAHLKSRIARGVGLRTRNDPAFLPFRWLSDGPGGTHPSFHNANQADSFQVAPGDFAGFEAGDVLRVPGGRLPILAVQPGVVARGFEVVLDVD